MRCFHAANVVCIRSIAAVLISTCCATVANAADPDRRGAPSWPVGKKVAFEMRDKPWSGKNGVLEWLSDQTGLPVVTSSKPTGTLNYVGVGGKTLTLPEVIDTINAALQAQPEENRYILIRRDASFTLVPADKKIDPAIVPRITASELDDRGNSEIVSVVIPLTSMVAEDAAPEFKKLVSSFGEVVALAKANQLVVQDTAGNVKRIYKTIKDIEDSEKGQAQVFTHPCKWIRARDAERILKQALGDPTDLLRATTPQVPQFGGGGFGRGGGGGGGFGRGGGGGGGMPAPAVRVRMHYITCDERSNTVVVTGPADEIAKAREIIKRFDVQQPGQPPVLVGGPILKTYGAPLGNAEVLAKTLQEIYKASSTIRISALGTNSILVWAVPEDQFDIAKHISGVNERPAGMTELLSLQNLDSAKVVDTLKGMLGDAKSGAPYLEADAERNAVIFKGTREQLEDVKLALKAIGDESGAGGGTGNMRVINLGQGSAAALAEELQRMLSRMRPNEVRVVMPGSATPKAPAPRRKVGGGEEQEEEPPAGPAANQPRPPAAQPAKPPITITAFGNRLVITTDDPEAMKLVQELVRLLTRTAAGEGDFEVIKLKYASAVSAAKELDEFFNGPKQPATPQFGGGGGGRSGGGGGGRFGGGGFNGFGGGGFPAAPAAAPARQRVTIVADPATNALLVKASPLDMLTIRRLLDKAIDVEDPDSPALAKTWVIPLKYATATEIAAVIREAYLDNVNPNNPTNVAASSVYSAGGRGFGGFARGFATTPGDSTERPRGGKLSISVDDRTNSLVLVCSQSLHDEVKRLVDQLEAAAKDSNRTVRVVSVKGIDPLLVQQAIDAIQGRRTQNQQPNGAQSGFFAPGRGFGPGNQPGISNMPGGGAPFGNGGFPRPSPSPGGGGGGTFSPGGGYSPGFQPGGGSNPGGGAPFQGGGGRGGGGGGGPGGGGGGGGSRGGGGGSGFFADRVKDDPQPTVLYYPDEDLSPAVKVAASDKNARQPAVDVLQPVAFVEAAAPAPAPAPAPRPGGEDVRGPRSNVTAEALEQLGVIVISGNNPADVEEVVRIIQYIQRLGAGAEVDIQTVPMVYADATSVSNILNQLFQRVTFGATGNIASGAPGTTSGAAAATGPSSVLLLPLPRFNAILVAAARARINDVIKEIKKLDHPNSPGGEATAFPLKKASAARLAAQITQFYATRYPNETNAQNQIRVITDDSTNTLFVQAAPADLADIRRLIERAENTVSNAINDLRVVQLKNALSDNLAVVLQQAINNGIVPASATAAPGLVTPSLPGAAPGVARPATTVGVTKSTTLRFISSRGAGVVQAGVLEDVHVSSDATTNSLILAAPAQTMDLLLALVRELDVVSALRSRINIFTLKKADAAIVGATLRQLFLQGAAAGAAAPTPGAAPPVGGGIGAGAGAAGALAPTNVGAPRQIFTLGEVTPEGTPIIPLRFTIDDRTNSLIVAGSENDLRVIETLVSRLEDTPEATRMNEIFKLHNAAAADVATALQTFWNSALTVISTAGQLSAYQEILRGAVVLAEPVSNTLLISATPTYFADIMHLVKVMDAAPPQVVVQILVAEVDLTDNEEVGTEIGLQSPVLFDRSVVPSLNGFGPSGTVTYANPVSGTAPATVTTAGPVTIPPGVTVNTSMNPFANPGFNFLNPSIPLGNNPLITPNAVGYQGLTDLGVGRISPTAGVGGFVFSAQSGFFNLLIRALKQQGRVDVLSRPQLQTMDNQTALLNIGQNIPIIGSTTITGTGLAQQSILRQNVGVILQVTPRISPDGSVVMRVVPEVSSVAPPSPSTGNGTLGAVINIQHLETTIMARDGETVAIGGIITKSDQRNENKVPVLGDLPWIGAAFRFRTQAKAKTELLIILTPHIVYTPSDADRILTEESRRMDWILGDVARIHGHGMELMFPMENLIHPPEMKPNAPALLPQPTPVLPAPAVPPTATPPRQTFPPAPNLVPGSSSNSTVPAQPPVTSNVLNPPYSPAQPVGKP